MIVTRWFTRSTVRLRLVCHCAVHLVRPNRGAHVPKETRIAIYARDGFRCLWCGLDLYSCYVRGDFTQITLDHLWPRALGGRSLAYNLVTACQPCNQAHGDRPWTAVAWERDPTGRLFRRIEFRRKVPAGALSA